MKRPRVLMICGDFPPALSGVGDYVDRLCQQLAADGMDIALLTTAIPAPRHPERSEGPLSTRQSAEEPNKVLRCAQDDGARPFTIMREMPSWGIAQRRKLINIARNFDLVHMQYPSVSYGRGPGVNLIPLFLKLAGVPCIVTIHDFRVMRKRWRARVTPMLTFATALVHVDGGDGPYLRRWSPFRHAPMTHIPIASNAPVLPCDPATRSRWRHELGFADDEFVVAHFGILYPHKGIPEMLDAIAALRSEGHNARALVAGDFDRDADYVLPITNRLLANNAVWVRGASLERVSQCLHAADAAALPFHSGASFNRSSMLACLQHGLPTVTTNGPATPSNLKDVYELLLVPIQDSRAVADALRSLITDPDRRSRLCTSALSATANLSWPAIARQHADFYASVLARPASEVVHENPQRA